METKQLAESVIARLMGFHETSSPSESVRRPHRVLSEDYIRKSDSFSLVERQSYRKRRLSKVNSGTGTKIVNSAEVQGREKLHRNSIDLVKQGEINLRDEMCRASDPPSKFVIFTMNLGKSKSKMMLDFFSARKANNQLFEKWKKGKRQFALTRQSIAEAENRCTVDKFGSRFEKGDHDEKTENLKVSSCNRSFCDLEDEKATIEKGNHDEKTENSKVSSCNCSFCDLEDEKATKEIKATQHTEGKRGEKIQGFQISAENLKVLSKFSEERHVEPTQCTLDTNDELCSYFVDDVPIEQESSVSSSCPNIDSEFHMSLGEYYSPSPDSVLDPLFSEEMFCSSDSFVGIGADPNDSEETHSEGLGMIVSTDEDSGDESVDCYSENRTLLRLFRPEECRDSSYVIDVLDEAGFFCNTKLGSKSWHFHDLPLDPSLFEMLEKRYDTHSSWKKSDRRLLFDRVNLGLRDIFYTRVGLFAATKPLGKCFKLSQSRDVIEDELWRLLLSQENGVNKTLSEKALETETKWFVLWDDIDFIVCEIEQFLFQELSVELLYD